MNKPGQKYLIIFIIISIINNIISGASWVWTKFQGREKTAALLSLALTSKRRNHAARIRHCSVLASFTNNNYCVRFTALTRRCRRQTRAVHRSDGRRLPLSSKDASPLTAAAPVLPVQACLAPQGTTPPPGPWVGGRKYSGNKGPIRKKRGKSWGGRNQWVVTGDLISKRVIL